MTISAAISYEKKQVGEKCSMQQRIKSESECRNAAKALSLPWSSTFADPGGNPGCTIANLFVYFNSRKDATGSDSGFVEICAIAGEGFLIVWSNSVHSYNGEWKLKATLGYKSWYSRYRFFNTWDFLDFLN